MAMPYDEQAYAQAKMAGSANLSTVKETPLTRLQYAVERLRKSDAVVSEAANRLVGERGPEINGAGQVRAPNGSGFLGNIEELADNVTDLASNIMDNIQRIERRL